MKSVDEVTVRVCSTHDVEGLHRVINAAYRCEPGCGRSWTSEGQWIATPRLSLQAVRERVEQQVEHNERVLGAFLNDKCVGSICASIAREKTASFGVFSVDPHLQGLGVGKKLMAEAERIAKDEFKCDEIELYVLAPRKELRAWYEKLGFRVVDRPVVPLPGEHELTEEGRRRADEMVFVVMIKKI